VTSYFRGSGPIGRLWQFVAHVTPTQRLIWKRATIFRTILTCGDGQLEEELGSCMIEIA
jgi:hypothetical protein